MNFRHTSVPTVAALLTLFVPGIALAQPAPHHTAGQEIQVRASVSASDTGEIYITQNRSNVFLVKDTTWARHLQNAAGETVDAKLKVTKPGAFGGEVEVLDLVRDVKGEVQLPMGGAPMISMNRSNVFQVKGAAWERYLLQRVGQVVEAKVRVVRPGMFGGQVEVVSLVRELEGEVFQPVGGAPMISVNKSNSFQVINAPFKSILAGSTRRRVEARVRLVEPGMFGGKVEVETLTATNAATTRLRVRGRPSSAAPVISTIAPGGDVTIVGATARYFEVELKNGRRGYVARTQVEVGEAVVGLIDSIPQ